MRKPGIFQRGKIWWIRYSSGGKQIRESSKSERYEDAERLLKRRQGEVVTGKFIGLGPERITIEILSKEIVDDYILNGRKSLGHLEMRLRLHVLPAFGKKRAAELSTPEIKRYIQARLKEKAAIGSINRELNALGRMYTLGLRVDPPLVARKPHIPILKENNVRTGFLEIAEYLAFREALPEEIRPLLVVPYYGGARTGELKRLKWPQVDLKALEIRLDPGTTKNDQGRIMPIYGEMIEWLVIHKEIRDQKYPDCPWVFHREGERIKDFRRSWEKAIKDAGIRRFIPHDLRRTAARLMSRAGISEKVIMAVCGWKTRAMFDRYNIVSQSDLDVFRGRMEAYAAERRANETGKSMSTKSSTVEDRRPN